MEKSQQKTVILEEEEFEAFLAIVKTAVKLLETKQKSKHTPTGGKNDGL